MYTVHIAYLNIMMNIPERDGPVFQVFVMYGYMPKWPAPALLSQGRLDQSAVRMMHELFNTIPLSS